MTNEDKKIVADYMKRILRHNKPSVACWPDRGGSATMSNIVPRK